MRQQWESEVISFLTSALAPAAIYVFGSVAKGTARADSDLDVAVLVPNRIPATRLFQLGNDPGARLSRPVDRIDFATAPETLQAEILRNGRLIAEADPAARATLIMRALSRYQRLNEEQARLREMHRRRWMGP